MMFERCLQRGWGQRDAAGIHAAIELRVHRLAGPACQHDGGIARLQANFRCTVFQRQQGCPRLEQAGLARAAAAISRFRSSDFVARQGGLARQLGAHALEMVALKPGNGGVALDVGRQRFGRSQAASGFAFEAGGTPAPLVAAGEFLHHADTAHGHRVGADAVAVRTADGQVVDTGFQHRVGQLRGGDSHVARGIGSMALRGKLARSLNGALLRLRQRQRLSLGGKRQGPA